MVGYVYLIGTPTFGWYKIGKSITPEIRVKNIGVLLPFKIVVIGIWKSSDHSQLESDLHQKHSDNRINGEWFRFSKKQIDELFNLMADEISMFRLGDNADSVFSKFSNIESDCPDGHTVRFKIKKMYGDFTPEQCNAIRIAINDRAGQKED